jgi:hypothetical protein
VALAAIRTARLLTGRSLDLRRHPLEGLATAPQGRSRRPRVSLRLMLANRPSPAAPLGARERAMLPLGSAPRCVARNSSASLLLTVGRCKTDQHGQGQRVAVWANPTEPGFCPAAALDAWLAHRRTAADLDWMATAASRAEWPLFCAVTKAGKVTGSKLPDKAVVRLLKRGAVARLA